MRIAQIAPLFESVPPRRYGGTERVVHWLTEALVEAGHEVTLFASGDSTTSAHLIPMVPRAQRFVANFEANNAPYARMLELVARQAHAFDVLHFHIDFAPFALFSRLGAPFLTTLHGRMDQDWVPAIYDLFADVPLVSVSKSQQLPMPHLRWAGTVHHGMPLDTLRPQGAAEGYLAFLGRISPEKGIADAVAIARATGRRLRVAAKIGAEDAAYCEDVVRPLFEDPLVDYIGEIDDAGKPAFLSGAAALLFPIAWPEPFGLVMIEAMACGTPVIAYPHGSVHEVIEPGLTGLIVPDLAAAIVAVPRAAAMDRAAIRARFEARWSAGRMAQDYVEIYESLVSSR